MLLLFWKIFEEGTLSGLPVRLRWIHKRGYPPRCLIAAEQGFLVFNPYMADENHRECVYVNDGNCYTSIDLYDDNILAGTSTGIKALDWNLVKSIQMPQTDVTAYLQDSYTTESGLLSNQIVAVEANNNYLTILTSSGLCWSEDGQNFITYATTSGADVFVDIDGTTYLADGSSIRIRQAPVSDFDSWDQELDLGVDIRDVWVNRFDQAYMFVATEAGACIVTDEVEWLSVSGSQDLRAVCTEYDTDDNWGHLFTMSSGLINIIDMKTRLTNTIISGTRLVSIEYPRIHSK